MFLIIQPINTYLVDNQIMNNVPLPKVYIHIKAQIFLPSYVHAYICTYLSTCINTPSYLDMNVPNRHCLSKYSEPVILIDLPANS